MAQKSELPSPYFFVQASSSDVVRMAWTDITDEAIKIMQQKSGAKLKIRLQKVQEGLVRHRLARAPTF